MDTNNLRLKIYLGVFTVLMAAGISGFMLVESFSFTDALYFTIVTMATVGYGDIHPQTDIGKVLALIIIIGGVGTFLGVIASITDFFVNRREEAFRHQKLNMVAGLFFSEAGNTLLNRFYALDKDPAPLASLLSVSAEWNPGDFDRAERTLKKSNRAVNAADCDLSELKTFLKGKSDFMLNLLGNPVVQEQESFTGLLRATFHLKDELNNREAFVDIPPTDLAHLEGDIVRIYNLLLVEWLRYMQYLKKNYAFLFSLAVRTNPFNPEAEAVVRSG